MRVRPECEAEFLARLENPCADVESGLCHSFLLQTGERTYCLVAQWYSAAAMKEGEACLLQGLGQMQHMLQDLDDGRSTMEPFSGHVVAKHRFPVSDGGYWSG
jgi:hypothetical protein